MNPLHIHDIIDNLNNAIPRPLELESGCFGSDPKTHKKIREEQTHATTENMSSVNSTSTSSSSSSSYDTHKNTIDTSKQDPESLKKREKQIEQ